MRSVALATALAALSACANPQIDDGTARPAAQPRTSDEAAAETITPGDMYARIAFLASDALRGRDTPSPGLEAAAAYIASELMRMGLEPAGDPGSFIQRYPYTPRRRAGDTTSVPAAEVHPPNVVGLLRGNDPHLRDSYVVFSAHMDHVGVGRPDASGDSIFNGADDDASGTSAILEVAEAFASMPTPPARSLIFLAVSGEEKGLLGSAYYADNPTVPIDRIVANINIDMIGRNAPDTVVAIGQEYSSLGPLVQDIARQRAELGLTVSHDPWPQERFFFRSDHFNFARREVPAIFFFTGTHEDYHRPSDHVEKIDADKAARVARLVFWLGNAIANEPDPPQWTEEGLSEVRALTSGRNR